MAQPSNDWGDMVMPGVYMIQRHNQSAEAAVANANAELGINYEQLYLEAEEIQEHIDKLLRSNVEIMEYLKDTKDGHTEDASEEANDEGDDDEQGMQGMQAMHDMQETQMVSHDEISDSDREIFLEALAENEGVIAQKKRRLAEILKIVASNACGSQFHKHTDATANTTAAPQPPEPADRFSL